ncbi:acyl-CoA dehydrogenase family protein, partial [Acinetobacter baumannii]
NLGAAHVIAKNGTAEQKQRLLPALASGDKIGAFLITEPQAGSETSALRTSARRDGDDFVINGTKQFISNGSEAGVAIIVARTDPGAGK